MGHHRSLVEQTAPAPGGVEHEEPALQEPRPEPDRPVRAAPARQRGRRTAWRRAGLSVASFVLLILVWYLVSALVGATVLPTPTQTLQGIAKYNASGDLWSDLGITLARVLVTLAVSFVVSVVAGILLSRIKWIDHLFGPWVAIFSAVPALTLLLVAFLGLGLNETAAVFGTALVVIPSMVYGVWQGMDSLDPQLSEMATVFGMSQMAVIRRVLLPQTWPFLFANIRQGLSLTWKIMIFTEILGLPSGVGYRMQYWYQLFNMEMVLASAIPFMVAMMLLEYAGLRPLERYLFRWKK